MIEKIAMDFERTLLLDFSNGTVAWNRVKGLTVLAAKCSCIVLIELSSTRLLEYAIPAFAITTSRALMPYSFCNVETTSATSESTEESILIMMS